MPDNESPVREDIEQAPDLENVNETLLDDSLPEYGIYPEPRRANTLVTFLFIIVPAFLGILYYFLSSPEPIAKEQNAKSNSHLKAAVPPTILVSLDGFRVEYLHRSNGNGPLAVTLNKLAAEGVHAPNGMQPVMPSKTWPNHWSIVTGLYPENHGIIANTMYDPEEKVWFHHDPHHTRWWHGEPIWRTIMRTPFSYLDDNNGRKTLTTRNYTAGTVFWPGSEVDIFRANAMFNYNKEVTYEERVKRVVDLLRGTSDQVSEPVNFVTMYLDGVDHAGHHYGVDSDEVKHAIEEVDQTIKLLIDKLKEDPPLEYNIILVADHGMTAVDEKNRLIDMSSIIPEKTVQDIRQSPTGYWLNLTMSSKELYDKIKAFFDKTNAKAKVFYKDEIPNSYHLKKSPLVPEVVTLVDLGWTLYYPHQEMVPGASKRLPKDTVLDLKGEHGFDNTEKDMQALFIAHGPSFARAMTIDNMKNIDLYAMMCEIYGATPAPNNGSLANTRHLLAANA